MRTIACKKVYETQITDIEAGEVIDLKTGNISVAEPYENLTFSYNSVTKTLKAVKLKRLKKQELKKLCKIYRKIVKKAQKEGAEEIVERFSKKLERVKHCCDSYERADIGIQHRKTGAVETASKIFVHHCHDRFCPICMRNHSDSQFALLNEIIAQVKGTHKKCVFLFMTTTIPNFDIVELGGKYKWYSAGNTRFIKTVLFEPVLGWYRTTEITKGKERDVTGKYLKNRVHLHYHWLLVVDKKYFKRENYITQEEWLDGCRKSYRNPNIKVLDIRRIQNIEEGLRELCKYVVKPTDFSDDPEYIQKLDTFLHKKRFIAKGGIIKELSAKIVKERKEKIKNGGTFFVRTKVYMTETDEYIEDRYRYTYLAYFCDPSEYKLYREPYEDTG
jgi:hypothetical protein